MKKMSQLLQIMDALVTKALENGETGKFEIIVPHQELAEGVRSVKDVQYKNLDLVVKVELNFTDYEDEYETGPRYSVENKKCH